MTRYERDVPKQTPEADLIDYKKFNFGKHKGSSPMELLDEDPGYLVWVWKEHTHGKELMTEDAYNEAQAKLDKAFGPSR